LENLDRISSEKILVYSSKDSLEEIFEEHNIFAVIHAATLYRRSNTPIENIIATNILLPVKLYELANSFNVNLFVNTDSFFNNSKYNYSYLPDYTLSKKHSIEWLKLMRSNCKLVNMKIYHMYGPNDAPNKFVPQIVKKLQENEPYIDITQGEQTRDFIFIDDVVSSYSYVLKSYLALPIGYIEYQVGTGKSISIKDFILIVQKLTKSNTELRFGAVPYRENEIMESVADNSLLQNLGWISNYALEEGIKKCL
jgi:nucleoside-diphosphate-sugar epimerase